MTAETAIYAPAPAPEWVRVADELGELDAGIERDSLRRADLAFRLWQAWELAGRPGGSFGRAIDERRQSLGLRTWGTQLYAWRDAGEARARGIAAPTAGEAARAGQALKEALEGRTVQEAVQAVQERVDRGEFKKGRNVNAPQGCTTTFIPTAAAETLDTVLERIARFAGDEWPTEKPDRLAALTGALNGRDDLQQALAAPQDWMAIERSQALELRRLAMIGRKYESENQNGVAG